MRQIAIQPNFRRAEITRLLGGKETHPLSRSTAGKLDRWEALFASLLEPSLCYERRRIQTVRKGAVRIEKGPVFKSARLSESLSACEEAIFFVATIGDRIERQIHRILDKGRPSEAYILDAMGSVAVESIVEKFHRHTEKRLKEQGKGVSLRYSPGYCDWPLVEQEKLFGLFAGFQMDVEITESCLMQPRKSISGVFGIIPSLPDPPPLPFNPCRQCQKLNCVARRR